MGIGALTVTVYVQKVVTGTVIVINLLEDVTDVTICTGETTVTSLVQKAVLIVVIKLPVHVVTVQEIHSGERCATFPVALKDQTVRLARGLAKSVILVAMGFGTRTAHKPAKQVAKNVTKVQEFVARAFRVSGVRTVQMLAVIITVTIAVFWMVYATSVKTVTGATLVSTYVMVLAVIIHFVRKTQGTVNYVETIIGEISVTKHATSAAVLSNRHALKIKVQYVLRVLGTNGAHNVKIIVQTIV